MLNLSKKKSNLILRTLTIVGIGYLIARGLYDYSTYKTLKFVERRLKHNTEFYYE